MQLPRVIRSYRLNRIRTTSNGYTANPMRLAGESATEVGGARDTYLLFITTSYISDPAVTSDRNPRSGRRVGRRSRNRYEKLTNVLPNVSAELEMGIAQTAAHARTER